VVGLEVENRLFSLSRPVAVNTAARATAQPVIKLKFHRTDTDLSVRDAPIV